MVYNLLTEHRYAHQQHSECTKLRASFPLCLVAPLTCDNCLCDTAAARFKIPPQADLVFDITVLAIK